MCTEIEIMHNINNEAKNKKMQLNAAKKSSYSIKKLLQQIFKARCSAQKSSAAPDLPATQEKIYSLESLESLDNLRNADIESQLTLESCENEVNERISMADCDLADVSLVPVHFLRTAHGTFYWTATSRISADNDLIAPLYCSTSNQIAVGTSCSDRWAQA